MRQIRQIIISRKPWIIYIRIQRIKNRGRNTKINLEKGKIANRGKFTPSSLSDILKKIVNKLLIIKA